MPKRAEKADAGDIRPDMPMLSRACCDKATDTSPAPNTARSENREMKQGSSLKLDTFAAANATHEDSKIRINKQPAVFASFISDNHTTRVKSASGTNERSAMKARLFSANKQPTEFASFITDDRTRGGSVSGINENTAMKARIPLAEKAMKTPVPAVKRETNLRYLSRRHRRKNKLKKMVRNHDAATTSAIRPTPSAVESNDDVQLERRIEDSFCGIVGHARSGRNDTTIPNDNSFVRPGAVAVQGDEAHGAEDSAVTGAISTSARENGTVAPEEELAIAAEVAPEQVDIEAIQRELRQTMINEAVRADAILEEDVKCASGGWKCWIGVVLALLVIAGVVGIAVGVAMSRNGGPATPTGNPTSRIPTPYPTTIPTPSPTRSFRFQTISQRLGGLFAGDLLVDESSVQFRALEWLVYDDPAMLPEGSTPLETLVERYVVVLLYFATTGENWNKQHHFLTNSSVCTWNNGNDNMEGVYCGYQNTVVGIVLNENRLQGNIPVKLGALENLSILDLSFNSLAGSIPEEIGNLRNLRWFDMQGNALTGKIPDAFQALVQLVHLDLRDNDLKGTIPAGIHRLPNLDWLSFRSNHLTGTIPSFDGTDALRSASYANNKLMGSIPSEIGLLTSLEWVTFKSNNLTGTIPTEIGLLTSLEQVEFSANKLTGTIPSFSGSNGVLREFRARGNFLSGGIESFLSSIRNSPLQRLIIWNNGLTGTIPTLVGEFTTLQTGLDLSENQFRGIIPTQLGRLTLLQELYLGVNQLNGTVPTELGQLIELTFLDLEKNQLTGTLPSELGSLVNLKNIYVSDTNIEGTIPTDFRSGWPIIESLWLHLTNIVGDLNPIFCSGTNVLNSFKADCFSEVICDCCTVCCWSNDTCEFV